MLKGRKLGEMIAFLALHPHESHSGAKLSMLLWGDSEVNDDRQRLRQEISSLRSLFAVGQDAIPLVHFHNSELRIDAAVVSDAIQFQELLGKSKKEPDTETRAKLLNEALSLYRTELLPEYSSGWIVVARERLCQFHEKALFDLAEAYRQQNDFTRVQETLARLVTHYPAHEKGHIALMRHYSEQGHPTRVKQQIDM